MEVDPEPVKFGRVVKWTQFIANFLEQAGLDNALRGFREDLLVMSPRWEEVHLPFAIKNLQIALLDNLVELPERVFSLGTEEAEPFKREQLKQQNGENCKHKGQITKEISKFLAENRARTNRSNRQEFVHNFHSKKARLFPGKEELEPAEEEMLATTCARVDAKTQSRDVQIKFDIAKNEDGPLRKTVKPLSNLVREKDGSKAVAAGASSWSNEPTLARHPGLVERFDNIEEHLALKYVPAPPYSLMERIRCVEEHIMRLEKEYPSWAALHFKQPRRGWPPPPPENPIIVPTHLTSSARPDIPQAPGLPPEQPEAGPSGLAKDRKPVLKHKSSLHKAIMDKLDVQRAMGEMEGPSNRLK